MALTEKGSVALKHILNLYTPEDSFTAKQLSEKAGCSIVANVLNPLVREGYCIKVPATSPVQFKLAPEALQLYEMRRPKAFDSYSKAEMQKQLMMSYNELCLYLIQKYGIVDGDYFLTPSCRSVNQKIKRGKEGLFIHHIKEDTCIMLSTPEHAIKHPFDYQQGSNLVYANIIEHLLLHMKITIEWKESDFSGALPGVGGVINFIAPQIKNKFLNEEDIIIESLTEEDFDAIMNDFFQQYQYCEMYDFCPDAADDYADNLDIFYPQETNEFCSSLSQQSLLNKIQQLLGAGESFPLYIDNSMQNWSGWAEDEYFIIGNNDAKTGYLILRYNNIPGFGADCWLYDSATDKTLKSFNFLHEGKKYCNLI